MSTPIGMKRTTPQLPLKRKTPLKAKKVINKMSDKQRARSTVLSKIPPPDDGRCENCHELPDFRGLQKHHKIFRSHNGSDDRDNIIWVCGKCHGIFHGIKEV